MKRFFIILFLAAALFILNGAYYMIDGIVSNVKSIYNVNPDIRELYGSKADYIMFVVGITAVITPVVYSSAFFIDSLVAVAAVVLLLLCVFRKKMLTRTHGMIMLAGYVGYFAYLMA